MSFRNGFRATIVLTTALLAADRVSAQAIEKRPSVPLSSSWRSVRSSDVTVVGNAPERELRRTLSSILGFRAAFATLVPQGRVVAPLPTTAIVLRDFSEFSRLAGSNIGGYARIGAEGTVLVFPVNPLGTQDVALHEYAHYLLHLNQPRIPTWMDEGLAEFFSTFVPDYNGRRVVGRPPPERWRAVREQGLLPLSDVVASDMSRLWRSQALITRFYATSWAFVHYLLMERTTPTSDPLGAYLRAVAQSETQDAAFQAAFGADVAGIEQELRAYAQQFRLPVITLPLTAGAATDVEVSRLPETDVNEIEGRLLIYHGAYDAAEKELKRALSADATHIPAQLSLGLLRSQQDRHAEAIALLTAAVEQEPTSVLALYYLGNELIEEWRYAEAVAALERATKTSPFNPRVWLAVSLARMGAGREGLARGALVQALQLEGNPAFFRYYAQAAFRLGQDDTVVEATNAYVDRIGVADTSAPYASLVAVLARRRQGRRQEAEAALARLRESLVDRPWLTSIVEYLQGKIDDRALLDRAGGAGERTEAHAYIGFWLEAGGRHEEALTHFRWVMDRGEKNYTEYRLVRGELARQQHTSSSGAR